jgi:hypothetical protein
MTTLKVLGHVVSRKGISPDPEKLLAVANFPSCVEGKTNADKVKRVQSFLGLCSYYRRHITGLSTMALPLILLTKKGQPFLWGEDQQKSFDQLKAALLSAPILAHPNFSLPIITLPDACGFGIGAVLSQSVEGVVGTPVGLRKPFIVPIRNKLLYQRKRMSGSDLELREISNSYLGLYINHSDGS